MDGCPVSFRAPASRMEQVLLLTGLIFTTHITLQLRPSPQVLTELLLPWGVALSLAPSGQGPGHISSTPKMHSCGRQNGELTLPGGKTQVLPLDPEACVYAKDAG